MSNYKLSKNDSVTPNQAEIGRIVRGMQADSLEKHKVANHFNQKGADIITQGVSDKMQSRGWPVGTRPPEADVSEKKIM
jgi:hypothetical protein